MQAHSGAHDFDFFFGTWDTHNRRRRAIPLGEQGDAWVEFPSSITCAPALDGSVNIDHFEGTFPDGEFMKGMTIRAYDRETQEWSLVWLSTRQSPDFRPLVGHFEDGVGTFYQDDTTTDGRPMRVRFIWDAITPTSARWQQAFSFDGGQTWDTNWIAQHTRRR